MSVEIIKGKAHHLRGEIHDALYWYRQSVLNHPTCSLSYFHLGEALLALNKLLAALTAYCKGLACHPTAQKLNFYPPPPQGILAANKNSQIEKVFVLLKNRCRQLISFGIQEIKSGLQQDSRIVWFSALQNLEDLESKVSEIIDHFPEERGMLAEFRQELDEKLLGDIDSPSELTSVTWELEKQMVYSINDAMIDKTLLSQLQEVAREKRRFEKTYAELLDRVQHFVKKRKDYSPYLSEQVKKAVVSTLKADEIRSNLLHSVSPKYPLYNAASFGTSVVLNTRKAQLRGGVSSVEFTRKDLAYQFAKEIDCPIPLNADTVVTLAEIQPQEHIVIKPLTQANSKGAYMVKQADDILDLGRRKPLQHWTELEAGLREDLETGTVTEDKWIVQELIYEDAERTQPARDLKFYCFYGEVALILEICRFPEKQFCWWNAKLEQIKTGLYEDKGFTGAGVTPEQIKFAASMSAKIPTPFIRIDFLKGWQGLVFCEFAALFPGEYHGLTDSIDTWLGNCFLDAEGRLMEDLLRGKKFEAYWRVRERLKAELMAKGEGETVDSGECQSF
ncbi:MAG: ATP-grasp fold amidoligase family protein [Phormidium sp.]